MISSKQKIDSPIFSVITVVYNAVHTLEKSINSVISQEGYEDYVEYIIIDGCSNDGSLDVILTYNNKIPYWISERDCGIYDAMNKAISISSGEWLYFLGADDFLEPNALKNIEKYFSADYVMIFGDVKSSTGKRIPSFFSLRTLLQNTIHHQGAFYHKSLFCDFHYDTQLKILSDYELNLKIYLNRLPVKRVPLVIACCQEGGSSSNLNKSLEETNIVRSRFLGEGIYNRILSFILKVYYIQKQIRDKV